MADYAAATIAFGDAGSTSKTLLALLKELLGECQVASVARDEELTMFLQIAGEAAERYTNNALAQKTVTESFKHSNTRRPLLYFPYVADSLATVEIDGEDVTADYEVVISGGRAYLVKTRCETVVSCCISPMFVTYDAGHDPLPSELGYAIAQAAKAYAQNATGGLVKKESVVGVGSLEYETADSGAVQFGKLPAGTQSILDQYQTHPG